MAIEDFANAVGPISADEGFRPMRGCISRQFQPARALLLTGPYPELEELLEEEEQENLGPMAMRGRVDDFRGICDKRAPRKDLPWT